MNETGIENPAKDLERKITYEIVYTLSLFETAPREGRCFSAYQSRIVPRDMEFIDFSKGKSHDKLINEEFVSPEKVLRAKLTDQITGFYSGICISEEDERLLSKYGSRADIFREQFQKDIDGAKNITIQSVLGEIQSAKVRKRDTRSILQSVKEVLAKRQRALEKMLAESRRQMARYMILWEYQDKGYKEYLYIAEGESCASCSHLNEKTFNISDAKAGKNFPSMHPNCDCRVGILNENGTIIAVIDSDSLSESVPDELNQQSEENPFVKALKGFGDLGVSIKEALWDQSNVRYAKMLKEWEKPSAQALVATLDYLTFSIPDNFWKAHLERISRLADSRWTLHDKKGNLELTLNPIYHFLNAASAGGMDTLSGALYPKEEYSAQHWADAIGSALIVTAGLKLLLEKNAATVNSVKKVGNIADDTAEGAGKGNPNTTKPYANSRPAYGKTQVDDVWNNYKDPTTGKAPDPAGGSISWDKTKPRQGQWDMGHIPGQKYSDMHGRYIRGEISQKEFMEWYRNPANYRPELPSTNRSHKYE